MMPVDDNRQWRWLNIKDNDNADDDNNVNNDDDPLQHSVNKNPTIRT